MSKNPLLVHDPDPVDPCLASPCGPNSICQSIDNTVACSCKPSFIGKPPSCRPECVFSSDCPLNLACSNYKCVDPCVGACGANAQCSAVSHSANCRCLPGFTGDPFSACNQIQFSKLLSSSLSFISTPTNSILLLFIIIL
jgi:hypothetical protein